MKPENLSSPAMITNVKSAMKAYGQKKQDLKEWALKSGRTAIVRQIMDVDLSQQEQSRNIASASMSNECRRIAVFGARLLPSYVGIEHAY